MSLPKKRMVDIQHETSKLTNIIELPIEKVTFLNSPPIVKLFISTGQIGTLPYVDVPGNIVTRSYDTQEQFTIKLDWPKVFIQERDILLKKVQEIIPEAAVLTPGLYKNAYVKDIDGYDVGKVFCRYTASEWVIVKVDNK